MSAESVVPEESRRETSFTDEELEVAIEGMTDHFGWLNITEDAKADIALHVLAELRAVQFLRRDALRTDAPASGTLACPLCGVATPHHHADSELKEHYAKHEGSRA